MPVNLPLVSVFFCFCSVFVHLLLSLCVDTKTRIVVVNASDEWAAVCAVCAEKVGVDASRPLSLSLDNGAELSDTLELNDNDHVIVTPIN